MSIIPKTRSEFYIVFGIHKDICKTSLQENKIYKNKSKHLCCQNLKKKVSVTIRECSMENEDKYKDSTTLETHAHRNIH